jgi:hypothetical protein
MDVGIWVGCWGGWIDGNFIINIVHVHNLTIRKKCIYVFPEKNTNNDWKKVIFANDLKKINNDWKEIYAITNYYVLENVFVE